MKRNEKLLAAAMAATLIVPTGYTIYANDEVKQPEEAALDTVDLPVIEEEPVVEEPEIVDTPVEVAKTDTVVATFNGQEFMTLQEAIRAAKKAGGNAVIEVLVDVVDDSNNYIMLPNQITFNLNGHTLTGFRFYAYGSSKDSKIVFRNGTMQKNVEANDVSGGALSMVSSNVELYDMKFIENTADSGGAVAVIEGSLIADNCEFIGNQAIGYDGGAISFGGTCSSKITNCSFIGNYSKVTGAAIAMNRGTFSFDTLELKDNSSSTGLIYGGGELLEVTLNNIVADSNRISKGGALYFQDVVGVTNNETVAVDLNNSTITNNQVTYGGAIFAAGKTVTMQVKNSKLSDNTATSYGGAVYLQDGATVNLEADVNNNTATYGGAVFIGGNKEDVQTTVDASKANIFGNKASTAGDDFYKVKGSLLLLPKVSDALVSDCEHTMDGWYDDSKGTRWAAHSTDRAYHVEKVEEERIEDYAALKAGHGVYDLKVNYLDTNKKALASAYEVLDCIEAGESYDLENTDVVKTLTGKNKGRDFTYIVMLDKTEGSLQGVGSKDVEVNLYYRAPEMRTVTVNYIDEATKKEIHSKNILTDIFENEGYDATRFDQFKIDGYTYSKTEGVLKADETLEDVEINVYYKKNAVVSPETDKKDPTSTDKKDPEKENGTNTSTQTNAKLFTSLGVSAISLAGILAILKKKNK